jgi:hypothetical protein
MIEIGGHTWTGQEQTTSKWAKNISANELMSGFHEQRKLK